MPRTRIATWNINSVRARLDLVGRFVAEQAPDLLCLQETKASNGDFPAGALANLGYRHQLLHGQRMHHGVAILSRTALAQDQRHDWQGNGEARHVGARLANGVRLECVYVPAGGDVPDATVNPKFGQKLSYLDRMTDWSAALREPTILVGDLNVAPLPSDVWDHKALLSVVSHTPVETERMERLRAAHGWIDLGRQFTPAPDRLFTWWSYRAQDWKASDRGRRLDHIWASPQVAASASACWTYEAARDWAKPSDHAPVVADFLW
jgi:exodeoxyribonuclease-3